MLPAPATGIPIYHDNFSYPPYGTVLSSTCDYTSVTDAQGTLFSGYYLNHEVIADGNGGSFDTYTNDANGCWYPAGYYYSYGSGTNELTWNGCSSSGYFTWGDSGSWEYADGNGNHTTGGYTNDNYPDGYIIYDDGSCQIIYRRNGTYEVNNYGGGGGGGPSYDPYGTKYGNPYWDGNWYNGSGYGALVQSVADGNGGTTVISWDGMSPYPPYGTQAANPNFYNGWYDSLSVYFPNQSVVQNFYCDGNGGTYYNYSPNGNWEYGFALSSPYMTSQPYYWTNYQDAYGNNVYAYLWAVDKADGNGGVYLVDATNNSPNSYPSYGNAQSDYFYDPSWNWGRLYADGMANYYFAP